MWFSDAYAHPLSKFCTYLIAKNSVVVILILCAVVVFPPL